ncbi:MAG: DNA translocase FtsK 4TM domain-containing protein [Candidatus Pelagibacter sp.]
MEIANFFKKIFDFTYKRIIEFLALILLIFAILIFLALFSYSTSDPNFIFPDNLEINNWLGYRGSIISDIFLQSIGLISFIIPISYFFISLAIFNEKKLEKLIECTFYIILYSVTGSFFFSLYFNDSFWLPINGNGGFVGNYLSEIYFLNMIDDTNNLIYYFLILVTLLLFIMSIKIKSKYLSTIYTFLKNLNFKRNKLDQEHNNEINFYDKPLEDFQEKIQENLPFEKAKNIQDNLRNKKFILPEIKFLSHPSKNEIKNKNEKYIDENFLEKILLDFGVEGKVKKISHGPVVTLNEFEPAPGVKVSKIINLSEDIARNTSSESARISTIPGSNTVGIELPNLSRENVYLSEIISSQNFDNKNTKLPIALGKSISGSALIGDLSSMPHLLIAGTTGSGKSVCINTIILSLLYKHTPEKCKFILIDPKMLELSTYEGIPHLLCPVITEAKRAASVLGWVVKEMESRYRLMTKDGVRNIDGYNSKHKLPMPYIVVIVDEMSDLMLVAGKEIEGYIQKLSQMARAAGIHIIMATQRPSVDVITGTIKANFPTRISFQVTSKIDSRTILGEQGAEQLLGKGDMLYMSSANKIVRIHAPYVSENEIDKINNFLRNQAEPDYVDEILNFADEKESQSTNQNSEGKDELYNSALEIIKSERKASTSFLQRKLQIGYNRAARIIDMMEENGEVSKANHVGKREVLK